MRSAFIVLVPVLALTSACATSRITAFRDPAYAEAEFSKIAVFAFGMDFESAVEVERQICGRLAPAQCVPGRSVLPPTRQYSDEEMASRLSDSGSDAVLIVSLTSDDADSRYVGTLTNTSAQASSATAGSVNLYGNMGFYSGSTTTSASATSVSTPVYSHSRFSRAVLQIFETESGNIAWAGVITTSGSGIIATGNDEFIRSATTKIAVDLKATRLVRIAGPRVNNASASPPSVRNRDVETSSVAGTVVARHDLTRVYESPSRDSKVVFRVMKGAQVPMIAESEGWVRVVIDGRQAFINTEDIIRQ